MKPILAYSPRLRTELQGLLSDGSTARRQRQDALGRLAPFASAGKLLRGCLVCFCYEAFSGRPADATVYRAALALELTQSALLIHDDIIDNDDERRGQPSLNRQYQTLAETANLPDPARFGVNMGLCVGDISLFLAFEQLAQVTADSAATRRLQRLFSQRLIETCLGQMQDIAQQARSAMPSKRAIFALMRAKTAAYSLALPLEMGAVLAGQPAHVQRQLHTFGLAAGTIFQIRDDELGALGDSVQTGKPVGADIREGKKTLLYYHLLKQCSPAERRTVKKIFGNPQATSADIARAQKLIKRQRIPAMLSQEIQPLRQRALTAIETLPLPAETKAELRDLVTFCARRQA